MFRHKTWPGSQWLLLPGDGGAEPRSPHRDTAQPRPPPAPSAALWPEQAPSSAVTEASPESRLPPWHLRGPLTLPWRRRVRLQPRVPTGARFYSPPAAPAEAGCPRGGGAGAAPGGAGAGAGGAGAAPGGGAQRSGNSAPPGRGSRPDPRPARTARRFRRAASAARAARGRAFAASGRGGAEGAAWRSGRAERAHRIPEGIGPGKGSGFTDTNLGPNTTLTTSATTSLSLNTCRGSTAPWAAYSSV